MSENQDEQPRTHARISMLEEAAAHAGLGGTRTGGTAPARRAAWGRLLGSRLFALAASLLLALGLCEVLLHLLGLRYDISPFLPDSVLHHVHPKNYRFITEDPDRAAPDFAFYYDARGRAADPRTPFDGPAKSGPSCRIAFLGDSFTESIQLPYRQSFVGLIDAASPCEVRNWGTGSYSPTMYGLQWRQEVAAFKPDLVILQLYSNDIWDDEVYAKIAITDATGRIVAVPGPPDGRLVQLMRQSHLARLVRKAQLVVEWRLHNRGGAQATVDGLIEENPDISERSSRLMDRLVADVGGAGSRLVLFVVPSKVRHSRPQKPDASTPEFADKWRAWAKGRPLTYADVVPPFRALAETGRSPFFMRDIHFNVAGHSLVAKTLCRSAPKLVSASGDCREFEK